MAGSGNLYGLMNFAAHRKDDAHAGAVAFGAFHLNFSPMGADKLVANGKPQAGTGGFGGEERIEDSADHAGVDAVSGVAEFDADFVRAGRGSDRGGDADPQ